MPAIDLAQRLRLQLWNEFISPPASIDSCSDADWSNLQKAIDLIVRRMRTDIEAGLHVKHLLPCDALVQAGVLTEGQLSAQIAVGRFDGQLCALPLRPV